MVYSINLGNQFLQLLCDILKENETVYKMHNFKNVNKFFLSTPSSSPRGHHESVTITPVITVTQVPRTHNQRNC